MTQAEKIMKHALVEIAATGGKCIYGTHELCDATEDERSAFRMGSAQAYQECAEIAQQAIADAAASMTPAGKQA